MREGVVKVAVLTDLKSFDASYSVAHVVQDQMRMLRDAHVDYTLFVRKTLADTRVNLHPVLTHVEPYHYGYGEGPVAEFAEKVESLYMGNSLGLGYRGALNGYDTVITHDLMTSPWTLPHNQAVRLTYDDDQKRRYFHWCHSSPTEAPEKPVAPATLLFNSPDPSRTVYVYPSERAAAKAQTVISGARTAFVYNARDIRDLYRFSESTCRLIRLYDLLNHEVFQVYPFDAIRWRSKGVDKLLCIYGKLKQAGLRVKLVLVPAHVASSVARRSIEDIRGLTKEFQLQNDSDVIFSHTYPYQDWTLETPHRVVRDLMLLSNLFIFPSESECCSLIQAEAAVSGCLLVLNMDATSQLEFADYRTMRYELNGYDPVKDDFFYERIARHLAEEIGGDRTFWSSTQARTKLYNRDWIRKSQLLPLLEDTDGHF